MIRGRRGPKHWERPDRGSPEPNGALCALGGADPVVSGGGRGRGARKTGGGSTIYRSVGKPLFLTQIVCVLNLHEFT